MTTSWGGIPEETIYDSILNLGNKFDFLVNWNDIVMQLVLVRRSKKKLLSKRDFKGSHKLVLK